MYLKKKVKNHQISHFFLALPIFQFLILRILFTKLTISNIFV